MKRVEIKRKDAGHLIERIAQAIAEGQDDRVAKETLITGLESILRSAGITLPTACTGEAHSNPHIDNCGVCMPNWGWVSQEVKVK